MSTNQVTVRLCRNFQFVGFDDKGHAVVLDADPPHGEGTGMRPMDMLIVSLGVCTGMDVVQGLRKLGQKLSNLEIKVSGEKNENYRTITKRFLYTIRCGERTLTRRVSRRWSETRKNCSVLLAPL